MSKNKYVVLPNVEFFIANPAHRAKPINIKIILKVQNKLKENCL